MSPAPGSAVQSWTGPRPFVGRDAVTSEILQESDAALADGGRAVFLLGEAGSGKTALLGVVEELTHRRHAELKTGYAECAPDDLAEPVWVRLDEHFTHSARMRRAALSLVPDWLQVVPVVGPIAAATVITVQRVRGRSVRRRHSARRAGEDSVIDRVRSLAEHSQREPCLVILDRLDRAGPDDLAGASALIRRLHETRILLVLAARTVNGRPPDAVRSLLLEAERQGRTRQIRLPGFDRDELLDLVSLIVRGMIPPAWLDWLAAETGGRPGRLWDRLGALERSGHLVKSGKNWSFQGEPPEPEETGAEALDAALEGVPEETRRLLAVAAVEGTTFHSAVVASLTGVSELDVEDRLAPLVRKGLLTHLGEHDLGTELTSRYAFAAAGNARALAAILPADERRQLEARAREIYGELAPDASR